MKTTNWKQLYEDGDMVIIDDFYNMPSTFERIEGMVCILVTHRGKLLTHINGESVDINSHDLLMVSSHTHMGSASFSDDFSGMVIAIKEKLVRGLVKINTSMIKCLFRASDHPVLHMTPEQEELIGHYKSILQTTLKRDDKICMKEIVYRVVSAMLYEIFTCIFAQHDINHNDIKAMSSTQGERVFKQFLELLVSSEVKQRQVQYYANKLCISSKYLSAVCKQVSGKPALVWINNFIVQDINYMLASSDWSIKEISNYLGFPNASFFGKYVRQHLGKSPTVIRAEAHKLQ
ncbi:MAG: helix-turn-helix domain-containing protein [Muribaculaceae bacterium]|nr:helix-turn-helix domain-containing protein [Muribaculaceae bacterium]